MGQTASGYADNDETSTNYTDSDEELLVNTDFCGSEGDEEDGSYYEEEEQEEKKDKKSDVEEDDNEKYVENPRDLPANDLRSHPREENEEDKGEDEVVNGGARRNDHNQEPTKKQPQDLPESQSPQPRILTPDDINPDDLQIITNENLRNSKPPKEVITAFDVDAHIPAITSILAESKEIRKLHFSLVPARMNEQNFFATLFYILRKRIESEATVDDKNEVEEYIEAHDNVHVTTNQQQQQQQESPVINPRRVLFSNMHDNSLEANGSQDKRTEVQKKLEEKTKENANLRKMLHETQRKLEKVQAELASVKSAQKQSQTNGITSKSAGNDKEEEEQQQPRDPKTVHKGTWVMDKDSREFLELDEELKINLRAEKEKRLQDVRDQMKFILDSDNVSHSFGEWDCCGKKEYDAESCA